MTLQTYAHFLDVADRRAADVMGAVELRARPEPAPDPGSVASDGTAGVQRPETGSATGTETPWERAGSSGTTCALASLQTWQRVERHLGSASARGAR